VQRGEALSVALASLIVLGHIAMLPVGNHNGQGHHVLDVHNGRRVAHQPHAKQVCCVYRDEFISLNSIQVVPVCTRLATLQCSPLATKMAKDTMCWMSTMVVALIINRMLERCVVCIETSHQFKQHTGCVMLHTIRICQEGPLELCCAARPSHSPRRQPT